MSLNRKIPPLKSLGLDFDFLRASSQLFENGVPFHFINQDDCKVIRLQFVFEAGSAYQKKPLIASSTVNLMQEGSTNYSSFEIIKFIEDKGAFFESETTADHATLALYCLVKNLQQILSMVTEILFEANYPENEIEDYLQNQKQNFSINSKKVGFIAKNEFLAFLLGGNNGYSNKIDLSDYDHISRNDLLNFYKERFLESPFQVFAAGNINIDSISTIESFFGKRKMTDVQTNKSSIPTENTSREVELKLEVPESVQTAIRIGKDAINKGHQDYVKLFVANTVLGGYFGSRLMMNIREDKGYTYGIGSAVISLKHYAYFVLSTEVGTEVANNAISEIKKEVNQLSNEAVKDKELQLVKNYLGGSLMRSFDGAFAAMDRFRSIHLNNLNYDYYDNLKSELKQIRPSDIMEISNQYLNWDDMKKIIVGQLK